MSKQTRPGRRDGDPHRRLLAAIFVRAARDTRSKDQERAAQAVDFLLAPEARELLTTELYIFQALPAFARPLCLAQANLDVEVTRCLN